MINADNLVVQRESKSIFMLVNQIFHSFKAIDSFIIVLSCLKKPSGYQGRPPSSAATQLWSCDREFKRSHFDVLVKLQHNNGSTVLHNKLESDFFCFSNSGLLTQLLNKGSGRVSLVQHEWVRTWQTGWTALKQVLSSVSPLHKHIFSLGLDSSHNLLRKATIVHAKKWWDVCICIYIKL